MHARTPTHPTEGGVFLFVFLFILLLLLLFGKTVLGRLEMALCIRLDVKQQGEKSLPWMYLFPRSVNPAHVLSQ